MLPAISCAIIFAITAAMMRHFLFDADAAGAMFDTDFAICCYRCARLVVDVTRALLSRHMLAATRGGGAPLFHVTI